MEPFVHALIPAAFLLALFPKLDKKYIVYLIPIVWIIDLDIFIGETHRFLFGNIFFVFLLAGIAYWLWDKRAFFVAFFYGISHLILDSVYSGTGWLWPLVNRAFYFDAHAIYENGWDIALGIGSLSREEFLIESAAYGKSVYFGETAALFLILAGILMLVKYRKEIKSYFLGLLPHR